ncbi:MAG: PKD domain-containing protein [Bacteroidetes bacterium]|nr:PKD domain-containing protein [Bacteroidota bacterium]
MAARFCIPIMFLFAVLTPSIHAQRLVTFDARHAGDGTALVLDSVRVVNLANGGTHTLIGSTTYDLDLLTGVHPTAMPAAFGLSVNYPNAFSDATSFTVLLPHAQSLWLQVFDLHGRRVARHAAGLEAGLHRFSFIAAGLPHGVYILTASNGSAIRTRKLLKIGGVGEGNAALRHLGQADAGTMGKEVADLYRFTAYAEAFEPEVIDNATPQPGQTFSFDLRVSVDPRIDPASRSGLRGVEYDWTLQSDVVPAQARYRWDFGDGQTQEVDDDRSVSHSYSSEGSYQLHARMYNRRNGNFISQASAIVDIGTEGRIRTGDAVEVARGDIGADGGAITVTQSGTPVTGLSVVVGAFGYETTREFVISYAPVLSHGMGEDFLPLSPLITLENGGGYSEDPMILCIPVTLPADHFAMVFLYDEQTGDLEGLPIISLDRSSICVASRHFSAAVTRLGKRNTGTTDGSYVQLIVAAVSTDRLSGKIMSSFRPGVDDWEFPNHGSYRSPSGHCAGQTISAMWYYSAQRLGRGEQPLNSRFDQVHTDSMWMDNPHGYRLCSVVQEDIRWDERGTWWEHFDTTGTGVYTRDSLNFLAFKYAVLMTEKPQYVSVRRPSGGHALILYGVDGDSLMIVDPNYPGASRGTSLRDGVLQPYRTMPRVGHSVKTYPTIRYYAKTAMIDYQALADRWKQFEEKTIGTLAPNLFPGVELLQITPEGELPLDAFVKTSSDTLVLVARCQDCIETFQERRTGLQVFSEQGNHLGWHDATGVLRIPVLPGRQRYGLVVAGWPVAGVGGTPDYISFVWLEVEKEVTASFGFGLNATCNDTGARGRYGLPAGSLGIPGTWSGDTFTGTLDMLYQGYQYNLNLVSIIDTMTNELESYDFRLHVTKDELDMSITLLGAGVPLLSHGDEGFEFSISGEVTCNHVDSATGNVSPYCGQLTDWDCKEHTGKEAFLTILLPPRH